MFERADHHRRVSWVSLVGLVLVPVIVAAGFLWATWGAGDRLHRVEAAVVNLDEAVTIDGQYVPLGRQLAAGLVGSEEENFTWKLVDAPEAESGLAAGRYAAVITIPENFSKAATSFSKDPVDAEQATIDIQTSQVTGVADSAIAQTIAGVAERQFNTTVTENYLDNIYLGFNKMQKQFSTIADGAGQLADGGEGLSDGVTKASAGSGELANGMGELSRGGTELDKGASDLATGTDGLADGAEKYATGVDQYTDGVHQLSTGAQQLATGVDKLEQGLPSGGMSKSDAAKLDQLSGGVTQLSKGAAGLSKGLEAYDSALTSQIAPAVKSQTPSAADLVALCTNSTDPQLAQLQQTGGCQAFAAGFQAGFGAGVDGMAQGASTALTKDPRTGASLISGADQLSTGAAQLSTGVDALIAQVKALPAQFKELKKGVSQLSDGADRFASGVVKLDKAGAQIDIGASGLATGSRKLADGVSQFSTGIDQYTDGVDKAAQGTKEFSTGMTKLEDGASKLADGQRTFADKLDEGADQVPTYNATERANLKTVVANPIANDTPGQSVISEVPATTLLMVLALWLGGLATFLVVQAVSSTTLLSSRPSWQLALRAMAPGAAIATVQAVALTIVGQAVLDLSIGKMVGVLSLLLLGGYVFVGLNHALAAWFGGAGRLLSVALVVLTAAGAITSAVPGFFDAVLPYSPLTPVLDGVRMVVTDGGSVIPQVGILLGWLTLALAASVGAVLRQRTVTPAALRLRYA